MNQYPIDNLNFTDTKNCLFAYCKKLFSVASIFSPAVKYKMGKDSKKEKKSKKDKEENGGDVAPKKLLIAPIAKPLADEKLSKKVCKFSIMKMHYHYLYQLFDARTSPSVSSICWVNSCMNSARLHPGIETG